MDETNFVTVDAPALIGVGAQSIVEQAKQLGLTWTFQPGTVGAVTDTMTTVTFDGDRQAINCVNLADTNLNAGDRVMGIITPTNNYVIGTLGAKLTPASNLSLATFGLSHASASTSYVNITGAATGSFIKRASVTAIRVDMDCTYYSTSAGTGVEFAVSIGGTDYRVARLSTANASLNAHTSVSGVVKVASALAAGTYTVIPRARATTGGGSINMDSGDNALVYLEEVDA